MKKLLLLIAVLFLHTGLFSQTLFSEDFDGVPGPTAGGAGTYTFPPGWLLRNVDNRVPDATTAYVNDAWERREDFNFSVIDSTMFSTSYYAPVGAANDWAWTPLIGPLPPNTILKWNAVTYDPAYPDGYEVRIMVAPNTPSGGTGVIGNQITNSTVIFSIAAENSAWTSREVSLAAYAGQSVYIAFRNNTNDKFLLLIDDVEVSVNINNDVALQSSDTITPYTRIPLLQTAPLTFGGKIKNNGINAASNVSMTTTIYDEADAQLFTSASNVIPSLASGASADFNAINTYLPTVPGTYTVRYVANMTQTDQDHSNDTIIDYFVVSDSTFSRSRGAVTASLGIGSGNGGFLGNQFTAANDGQLTSVSIHMVQTIDNTNFGIAIWDFVSGSPNAIIYQSEITEYGAYGDSTYIFPVDIPILAGQKFLVSAVEIDSTLAIAQTNDIFTPGTTWVDWPANPFPGWANNEDFGINFSKPYDINAHFSACENTPDVSASPLNQSVCADDATQTILFTGSVPGTVFQWTNSNPSIGLVAAGTGDIPSFQTINNSGSPVTATIIVTPVLDEVCAGTPVVLTITVNSASSASAAPLDQELCSNSPMQEIVISALPSGSFTWTRDNLTEVTGIPASGSGNITGIPLNTTNGPVTVSFTITPEGGSCGSEPVVATISVNTELTVEEVQNIEVCEEVVIPAQAFSSNDPEATFFWTNDNPAIGLTSSGSGNVPQFTATNPGTTPITANITVSAVADGSGGNSSNLPLPEMLYYNFETNNNNVPNLASSPPAGAQSATVQGSLTIDSTDNFCGKGLFGSGNSSSTDYLNTNWVTNLTGSWTISFKTQYISANTTLFYIFGDATAGSFRCFTNGVAGANNWILRGTDMTDVYLNGGATNDPHTCTFVYDQPGGVIKAYLDGVLVETVPQSFTPVINGGGPFKIMGYGSNVGSPLNGQLDEFRLYSRALDLSEVELLAGCPISGCGSEPMTYTITVNPGFSAEPTPSTQITCSGENIETIQFNTDPEVTTTWTRNNTATVTGIPASGTGNISGMLNNTMNDLITVTFFIESELNGCITYDTATVSVGALNAAVVCPGDIISGMDSGECSATVNYTVDGTGISTTFTFSGATTLSGSGTGSGSIFNPGITTVQISSNIGCVFDTCAFTVTVNDTEGPDMECPDDVSICAPGIVTFSTPVAMDNCVVYISDELPTTLMGENYHRGNMFEVVALNDIIISSFDAHPRNNTNIAIYYRQGSFVGFESNMAEWNLIGAADVVAQPYGSPTPIPVDVNVHINAGERYSFYITSTTPGIDLNYSDGTIQDSLYSYDENLEFYEGIGLDYPFTNGGGFFSPRIWNGIIHYEVADPETSLIVTQTAGLESGSVFPYGTTTNTFEAEDGSGNITTCSFDVVVGAQLNYEFTVDGTTYENGDTITSCHLQMLNFEIGSVGIYPFTFTRLSNGNVIESGTTPATFAYEARNAREGYYTLTLEDENGCLQIDTIYLLVNTLPNPTATATPNPICAGQDLQLGVNGNNNFTFAWSGPGGYSSNVKNPLISNIQVSGSGDYIVTVTNLNGCSDTSVINVFVSPVPIVNAVGNQSVCNGTATAPVTFSGSIPGATYTWTNYNPSIGLAGSGTGNIASFNGSNNGTTPQIATITVQSNASSVENPQGCNSTPVVFTITVNPTPNAVATPASQTICSAGNITPVVLTGNVAGTTFNWTRDNTANVTGIAGSGSGNISGALVNTTNAAITVTFTIIPTANGCPGTAIIASVVVNPAANLSATPTTQTVCSGQAITAIVPAGGLPGAVYNWTRNNTANVTGIAGSGSGSVTGMLNNLTTLPVTVTFTFNATTPGGCASNPVTATVIVNPRPAATLTIAPNPACVGTTVQLSATGGVTYSWAGPQGWTSTLQNPSIFIANHQQAGKYTVTVTATGGCSVVLADTLDIFYPPVAEASYELSTACVGSDLQLHAEGAGSYSWTGPGGWTSNLKDPVIEDVTAVQSGIYTLTVTSPNGCTAISTLNIIINLPPAVSANPQLTEICIGSKIQLTASGTGTFAWSGPATYYSDEQNPVIQNIPIHMSGIYVVTLTAATGCSSTDTVEVKVYDQIYAKAAASPDTICEGQSLQLHAEGGTSYLWIGPAGFIANEADPRIDNITLAHAGKYYVYISNEGGCFGYAELNVTVLPSAKGSAYASPNPVLENNQVQFFASNGLAYSWSGPLGFTSTVQNPLIKKVTRYMSGVYTVTITNENGCPTVLKVNLRVQFTNKGLNNTFTGDGDVTSTRSDIAGNVYPNPTNNYLYFETESKEAIEYIIYDTNGKIQQQLLKTENNYISTDKLSSGIYQIRWKPVDSEEWLSSKFAKLN